MRWILLILPLMACKPQQRVDLSTCETWASRKTFECRDEVVSALDSAPSPTGVPVVTMYDECLLSPTRRQMYAQCSGMETCEEFAACTIPLMNAPWSPAAEEACDALVLRRRFATAYRERVEELFDAARQRKVHAAVYELDARCRAGDADVLRCAALPDGGMADCLIELSGVSQ